MFIDVSLAPLVYIRADVESDLPMEEQFNQLLDAGAPFVLITNHSHDDHPDETVEERREKAQLFKRIKDRMARLCLGMIVLEGKNPTPAPMRAIATSASKIFGFVVLFASSEEEALRKGDELLAKRR